MSIVRRHVPDPGSPFVHPARGVDGMQFRGCCVRFEDQAQGPYILYDSAHHCVGVGEVRVTDTGRIEIVAADGGGKPIVAMHVTVDDSFAKAGFFVGPSGGAAITVPVFGHRSGAAYTGLTAGLYGAGRNIWCTWWTLLAGS